MNKTYLVLKIDKNVSFVTWKIIYISWENNFLFGRFVEYGEYKGHLYGTSLDSIKTVIHRGKVCLLSPHTQVIHEYNWEIWNGNLRNINRYLSSVVQVWIDEMGLDVNDKN